MGVIVGGVLGGVAALLAIATLVFLFHRKRRRRSQQTHFIDLDPAAGEQWETTAIQDSHKPQRLYDPSDPSTFPPPAPVDSGSYESSQTHITPAYLAKYTGSAEI